MHDRYFRPVYETRSMRRMPSNRRPLVNYSGSSLREILGARERVIPIDRTLFIPDTRSSTVRSDDLGFRTFPIERSLSFSDNRNDRDWDDDFGYRTVPIERSPSISDTRGRSSWSNDSGNRTVPIERSPDVTTAVHTRHDEEKPKPVNDAEDKSPPEVDSLDLHLHDNTHAHHTDKFEQVDSGQLIVRRGQPFDITVTFDRKVDNLDNVQLVFETGTSPLPGKGTQLTLSTRNQANQWRMQVERMRQTSVKITVTPSADCCVGDWKMTVTWGDARARFKNGSLATCLVFILFNPWCREDSVHFRDQNLLSEYILNDSGCIFTGTHEQIGATPWFYGQFEKGILEAAIYCVQKGFNFRSGRFLGDPVKVARAISAVVNSNDEGGVLAGCWSADYPGGTSPQSWVGSVRILRQYMDTKLSVRYGQCFVFAGIVTTICRALGLPCRNVTNFCSAHDTDGNVTVDVYVDASKDSQGLGVNSRATDSVWNFHVWNDVWMKRPDLPAGNDGWQVVDATPQEQSKGVYQCGPAPLAAVLRGDCAVMYDVPFIFAEVNADRVFWARADQGPEWKMIGVESSAIGKKLSTKVPDGRSIPPSLTDCERFREDVTAQYKFPEHTDRERMSVLMASMTSKHGRHDVYGSNDDIEMKVKNNDHVMIGADFKTTIVFTNRGQSYRTLNGKVICDVTSYTGNKLGTCHQEIFSVEVPPWQTVEYSFNVGATEYMKFRTDAIIFKQYVIARIDETDQLKCATADFRLRMPDLKLKVLTGNPRAGSPLQMSVRLRNPLPKQTLTNCRLVVECSSSDMEKGINVRNVRENEEMEVIVTLTPRKRGIRQVFASFDCDQLRGIKGVEDVLVY